MLGSGSIAAKTASGALWEPHKGATVRGVPLSSTAAPEALARRGPQPERGYDKVSASASNRPLGVP